MQGISSAVRTSLDHGPFDFTARVGADPALGWTAWGRQLLRNHHLLMQSTSPSGAYKYSRDTLAATISTLKRFFTAHAADIVADQAVAHASSTFRAAAAPPTPSVSTPASQASSNPPSKR